MLGKIRGLRAMVVAATAVTLAGAGSAAYAASNSTSVIVKGPDHQRLTFVVSPGGSHTFALPSANDPIRIDLDKVSTNGGVQTPSEVFSALINVDANHAGASWIGTNSDGSQTASSTIKGTNITNLVCGSSCVIASLNMSNVANRTVVLRANAATSSIREEYVVNIWY
jgi:hypothetical protein